jgi:hypothetical protein
MTKTQLNPVRLSPGYIMGRMWWNNDTKLTIELRDCDTAWVPGHDEFVRGPATIKYVYTHDAGVTAKLTRP